MPLTQDADAVTPAVTILIPCRNEQRLIRDTLLALLAQRSADGEPLGRWAQLIVVDDESSDRTPQILAEMQAEHPEITVLRNEPRRGLAGSYNRGIGIAEAPVLLTCHADCQVQGSDYLVRMLAHFNDPNVGAVTGKPATPDYAALLPAEKAFVLTHLMDVEPDPPVVREINFAEGRCDAFRTEALRAVGLYDETMRISGEDQILANKLRRLGLRLLQDTSLLYTLSCGGSQDSVWRVIRRHVVLGESAASLIKNHGLETSRLAHTSSNRARRRRLRLYQITVVPAVLVGLVVAAILAPRAALALLAAAIVARFIYHLVLVRGRFGLWDTAWLFPVCLACDIVYCLSFYFGMLKPNPAPPATGQHSPQEAVP